MILQPLPFLFRAPLLRSGVVIHSVLSGAGGQLYRPRKGVKRRNRTWRARPCIPPGRRAIIRGMRKTNALLLAAGFLAAALGSARAADAPAPEPAADAPAPAGVTGLTALHRSGQTFITWKEILGRDDAEYLVYRSKDSFDGRQPAEKELAGVVRAGSAEFHWEPSGDDFGHGLARAALEDCGVGGRPLPRAHFRGQFTSFPAKNGYPVPGSARSRSDRTSNRTSDRTSWTTTARVGEGTGGNPGDHAGPGIAASPDASL